VTPPTLLAAFFAGLLAFASPCVLPLLPGYVAFMSGQLASSRQTSAVWRPTFVALAFVAGFTAVFVSLGATASIVGRLLLSHRMILERTAGVGLVVLGLVALGVTSIPPMSRELRFHPHPPPGLPGSLLLGAAFALGWSPCIGPTLAAALAVAAGQGGAGASHGAPLLAAYSVGLGAPFVALAVGTACVTGVVDSLKRNGRLINVASGLLLVVVGTLLVLGQFTLLSASRTT
jgi:cytochrome c-type biogenesis protein